MKNKLLIVCSLIVGCFLTSSAQEDYKLALLKYGGGGDWYSNPTSLTNLARFCNDQWAIQIPESYATVEVGSAEIYDYPFLHMTGHGNVVFSKLEAENLRTYLESGGFLHIDDNYGMKSYIDVSIKTIFPGKDWIELPPSHPIFHQSYDFPKGLPKIHKHDGKAPQAFAIIHEGRVVCLYTYECDLGDGWEDQEVHNDTPEVRLAALQMGANILQYVFGFSKNEIK